MVKASLLAFSSKRLALDWLKLITDQTFDSPEQWVQWWQKNHSNLILSADGRKLVHPDEMLPRGMAGQQVQPVTNIPGIDYTVTEPDVNSCCASFFLNP